MTKNHKKIDIKSKTVLLNLFSRGEKQLLIELESALLNSTKTTYIVTPNSEQIVQAFSDQEFAEAISQVDYRIPDGVGVVWATKLLTWCGKLNQPVADRIAGVDLVAQLLQLAARHNLSTLVLGGREYPSTQAQDTHPAVQHLKIAQSQQKIWWLPGYESVAKPTPAEETVISQVITKLKPDLVFVAFGAPSQELWLSSHRELLETNNVKLAMVVGGSFDYLTGKLRRAPILVQQLGLEWLFRLIAQPWRWRRQLRLIQFIWITALECIRTTSSTVKK